MTRIERLSIAAVALIAVAAPALLLDFVRFEWIHPTCAPAQAGALAASGFDRQRSGLSRSTVPICTGQTLGFGAEPVAREPAALPLLAPRDGPPVGAAYRRDLFGSGAGGAEDTLPDDAPDLTGIVGRIGRDAVALARSGGTTRTIAVGEGVDGWTLESLAIDAAYFTRGGQRVRVPLPAGEQPQ